MLRSLAAQMDPVLGARSVTATRVINTMRVAGLVIVVVTTVWLARPGPASGGARGPAIAVMLGVSAAAWIAWILSDGRGRLMTWSLVVMGAAGGVLAGLSPNGPAVGVGCVATFSAGARLSTTASLGVTAETVAGFLATGLATGIADRPARGLRLGLHRALGRGPDPQRVPRPGRPGRTDAGRNPPGARRPRPRRPRSPSGPGSPATCTTCSPTPSPRYR